MLQAVGKLITTRRNFLVRASAITAAGATVAVPVVALASSEEQIRHHLAALKAAFASHFGSEVSAKLSLPLGIAFVEAAHGYAEEPKIEALARAGVFG